MSSKFKVGDKVILTDEYDEFFEIGAKGKIVHIRKGYHDDIDHKYGVIFYEYDEDHDEELHSLWYNDTEYAPNRNGYWCASWVLKLQKEGNKNGF